MAPAAIIAAVQLEAPAAVRDAVQLVLKEVVENRTEPLRRMVGHDGERETGGWGCEEGVQLVLKEVVDNRTEPLRRMVGSDWYPLYQSEYRG